MFSLKLGTALKEGTRDSLLLCEHGLIIAGVCVRTAYATESKTRVIECILEILVNMFMKEVMMPKSSSPR